MTRISSLVLTAILTACHPAKAPADRDQIAADRAEYTLMTALAKIQDEPDAPFDIAAEARSFLFVQAELIRQAGRIDANQPFAEILSLMGRDDLINDNHAERGLLTCSRAWVDPVSLVRQRAEGAQILILAEASPQPRQRAFVADLIEPLAEDGFSAFSSDALAPLSAIVDPDTPLLTDGVRARDPMFGRLMRSVKSSGLKIVPFTPSNLPAQQASLVTLEEASSLLAQLQVRQIAIGLFAREPEARLIVHLGFNPGSDRNRQLEMFTSEARRILGVEPVTIAMADCFPPDGQAANVPAFGDGQRPLTTADMLITHPIDSFRSGRPDWRIAAGERTVDIPNGLTVAGELVLVEARRLGEPDLAVPEDRLILFDGERVPLILRPGAYRIEAWTRGGLLGERQNIQVE